MHRNYGLDIIRCVAILTVVIGHSFGLFVNVMHTRWADALTIDGVTIFFVLSGFLIGRILIRMHGSGQFETNDLRRFWMRRWLRTLPAYFACLFVALIIYFLYDNYSLTEASKYFIFIQNLHGFPKVFPESWSLCVEEWFYLLIPLAIYLTRQWRLAIPFWICATIVLVTTLRIYNTPSNLTIEQWQYSIRFTLLYRMDSIMFGVLAAYISLNGNWKNKNALFAAGIILMALLQLDIAWKELSFVRQYLYLSLAPIAVFLAVPKMLDLKTGEGAVFKFVTFTSVISYSIYLVHLTLFYRIAKVLLSKAGLMSDTNLLLLYFVWAYGAGFVLYKIVERPFMALREKLDVKKEKLLFPNP